MFRNLTLRVRLALLVGGTVLPLIVFAGVLIVSDYNDDRRNADDRVLQVSRGIRQALDREMQGIVGGLVVLANSRALAADDFEGFRISADAFVRLFPGHPAISIGDEAGDQLFNSSVPAGAPLPPRTPRVERDSVFRTGKPTFSPVFIGSVTKMPIVTVSVPVLRNGNALYDVSFNPPLEVFQHILEQQRPSEEWTMSIFDQQGRNIARLPNPERTIGQSASPQLLDRLFSATEAPFPTVSREGVELITVISRSDSTGWIAVSGIAKSTLTAPALTNLVIALSIGGLLLLIGLGFALRMASQIARGEALHQLLINELNHRVKNTLATVQSVAAQTFRGASDTEARQKFNSRLVGLGSAHDLLSASEWKGADIREALAAVIAPFQSAGGRIAMTGPPLQIDARTVTMLAMVIQELATNAAKYGALSNPEGRVAIDWEKTGGNAEPRVALRWVERSGPPVKEPQRSGFGSGLIQQGVAAQLGGRAKLTFKPEGLVCELDFPLR